MIQIQLQPRQIALPAYDAYITILVVGLEASMKASNRLLCVHGGKGSFHCA